MLHFNALASSWWDTSGPQRILHKMNLLRMDYIQELVKNHIKINENLEDGEEEVYIPPFSVDLLPQDVRSRILQEQHEKQEAVLRAGQLRALDVGCGGGILSESLGRLPWIQHVTGVDLSADVLEAAKVHQNQDPALKTKIDYKLCAIEDLPAHEKYDIVTVFEMLEHVDYPSEVLKQVLERVAPGGWVFLSTINRDPVSWFTTIAMGEHILGIVPPGTHTIDKYINESEIRAWVTKNAGQVKVVDSRGCAYVPGLGWKFTPCAGLGNYFMALQKTS